jgi:hypothetical protein
MLETLHSPGPTPINNPVTDLLLWGIILTSS